MKRAEKQSVGTECKQCNSVILNRADLEIFSEAQKSTMNAWWFKFHCHEPEMQKWKGAEAAFECVYIDRGCYSNLKWVFQRWFWLASVWVFLVLAVGGEGVNIKAMFQLKSQ